MYAHYVILVIRTYFFLRIICDRHLRTNETSCSKKDRYVSAVIAIYLFKHEGDGVCHYFFIIKSGKPRSVPLNKTTLGILERRAKTKSIKKDLVFFSSHGTKLDNSNLVRAFKEALRKAKISDFTWHGLRRTFATRLAHKGLDIYKISRLLGHADVQTTQKRYAHHCTESLRIGVDILDPDYVLTTFGEKEGFLGASKLS